MREHLILFLETLIGSTWRHQLYTFLFSRVNARGTAGNKHDISVCIDDILCTCLRNRFCFSPKPFLLCFSRSIAYEFITTLSGYDWMITEISGCVLANSIQDIATASVFVFFWILSTDFMVLNVFYQGTINFVLGITNWFHMETPALHI